MFLLNNHSYICVFKYCFYVIVIVKSILNISEAASIAIHSMAVIAQSEDLLNSHQVACKTGFSKNHTAKVLQTLAKYRLLRSTRGPGGGFRLGRDAQDISLMDIYRVIDGDLTENNCGLDCAVCPVRACIFGGLEQKFTNEFRSYLMSMKLAILPAVRKTARVGSGERVLEEAGR